MSSLARSLILSGLRCSMLPKKYNLTMSCLMYNPIDNILKDSYSFSHMYIILICRIPGVRPEIRYTQRNTYSFFKHKGLRQL